MPITINNADAKLIFNWYTIVSSKYSVNHFKSLSNYKGNTTKKKKKIGLFQHIYFEGLLKMVAIAYNFVQQTEVGENYNTPISTVIKNL
jgi:hypothetical protein